MKKLFLLLGVTLATVVVNAQFSKATVLASGLTCSLCNNAIYKALKALPFVSQVKSDIKNAAFDIQFSDNKQPDIDAIKNAVEDAGFSVANLTLTGSFTHVKVINDGHVTIGGKVFHFLNVNSQELNGEKTLTIVDKNFVPAKTFKKMSRYTHMSCLLTGRADQCCLKDHIVSQTRIYHVTI
jgi:copper chaperone CopZ